MWHQEKYRLNRNSYRLFVTLTLCFMLLKVTMERERNLLGSVYICKMIVNFFVIVYML